MDKFFTQTKCDRCGGSLEKGRTMSMINTECICLECKEKEQKDPQYKEAQSAEMEQVKQGNYNYKGIGRKP